MILILTFRNIIQQLIFHKNRLIKVHYSSHGPVAKPHIHLYGTEFKPSGLSTLLFLIFYLKKKIEHNFVLFNFITNTIAYPGTTYKYLQVKSFQNYEFSNIIYWKKHGMLISEKINLKTKSMQSTYW